MTAAAHSLASFPSGAPADGQPSAGVSSPVRLAARDAESTWVPLSQLYGAFDGEPETRRQSASRWVRKLPAQQVKQEGRNWLVLATARFRNNITVQAYLHAGRSVMRVGPEYPPNCDWWNAGDSQRYLDTIDLVDRWNAFRTSYGGGSAALPALDAFAASDWGASASGRSDASGRMTVAEWAAVRGLTLAERSLRRYAERIKPGGPNFDGNVDRRGKHKIKGVDQAEMGPAWDFFKVLWLDPNRPSIRICWEMTRMQARRDNWQWPALRTVQRWVQEELPNSIADFHRQGEKRWERSHAPRTQRDYSVYRSNELWVGDHHRFDVVVMTPSGPDRPWLTAWLDMRSRMLLGRLISLSPCSDSILKAFSSAALEHGLPNRVTIDNGKDYRAYWLTGGKGRRPAKKWENFNERSATVFGRCQVEAHFTRPFEPQSKHVESFFHTVKERFSKLWPTYCGGKPDERPETLYADLRARQIEPPTLAEFEAAFERWVADVYHLTPHSGDSMHGLPPIEAFARDAIARRTTTPQFLADIMEKRVPATVTRRGVNIGGGIYYGQDNADLWKIANGTKVLLGINPVDASAVRVYDIDGRFITTARNERLTGATPEQVKQGLARQRRAKKLAAKALPALRDSRKTTVDHALDLLAEAARDESQPLRATGTDAARPLKLVPQADGAAPPRVDVTPAAPQPHYFDIEDTPLVFETPAEPVDDEADYLDRLVFDEQQ